MIKKYAKYIIVIRPIFWKSKIFFSKLIWEIFARLLSVRQMSLLSVEGDGVILLPPLPMGNFNEKPQSSFRAILRIYGL